MRSMLVAVALLAIVGADAAAQGPVPGPRGAAGAPGAQMLLSRTGELQLTDAQVVRLAAIARRAEARRAAMRASMDSVRSRFGPGNPPDSAARRQLAQRMRTNAERMMEQERADRRDAIAVLTPDQQARAWEMVASRRGVERGARGGRGARGAPGARGMRGMDGPRTRGMRPGTRPGMRPGMRPEGRGPEMRRPPAGN
jgi:Spy/CpxP family protein refolding chaperone